MHEEFHNSAENNLNPFRPSSELTRMILAKQLKDLLKQKDTTIAQLARATHISSKTLYQWLNGQKPRDLNQVKKVANYFDVSLDYLAFGEISESKVGFEDYKEEINAGHFEVILRRIKK